jgi:hypothetical protein
MFKFSAAALCAALVAMPAASALAHGGGGGGGGGHGGGHSGGGGYYYYGGYYGGGPVSPFTHPGEYTNIHTIAVISAVGQSLMLGRAGWLASHSTLDISDWRLDESIEALTGKLLSSKYTVKQVPHDIAALAKIPNGFLDTSATKAMQAYIQALDAKGVDAIMVIRPDAETGTPATPGLSLQLNDTTGRPREEANFEVDIVDPSSGIIIARSYSRVAERQGLPAQFAAFNGAASLKLKPNDVPTAEQRAQLKTDYERDMAMAMRETLRSLKLDIALPEVGARNLVAIPPADNPCRKLKRVMVISTVGDRVEVDYPGSLFKKRQDNLISVADWNFDGEVEKMATGVLDSCFQVVNVPVDRAKLSGFVIGSDKSIYEHPVDGITPGQPVDIYLVFAKLRNERVDNIAGLAMSSSSDELGIALSEYAVLLVDGKSGRIGFMLQGISSPKWPYPVPGRAVVKTNMPNPGDSFTPEQAAKAHAQFTQMMADSVAEMLLRMQFTGKRIESAATELAEVEPAGAEPNKPSGGASTSSAPASPH